MSMLKVKIARVEPLVFRCMPYKDYSPATQPVVSLSPETITFAAAGGEQEVEITGNGDWTAE